MGRTTENQLKMSPVLRVAWQIALGSWAPHQRNELFMLSSNFIYILLFILHSCILCTLSLSWLFPLVFLLRYVTRSVSA